MGYESYGRSRYRSLVEATQRKYNGAYADLTNTINEASRNSEMRIYNDQLLGFKQKAAEAQSEINYILKCLFNGEVQPRNIR